MRISLLAALLVATGAVHAQTAQPLPPPPMPPAELDQPADTELAPEVRIRRRGEEVIEEYSVQGRVYMLRITPTVGAPYYLIDSDGDGRLETFHNALEPPTIVQWRIFGW